MEQYQDGWGDQKKQEQVQSTSTALSNLMTFLIFTIVIQLFYNLYLLITKVTNFWQIIIGSVVMVITIFVYSFIGKLSVRVESLSEDNLRNKLKVQDLEKRLSQLESRR
jgi:prepilin signal peptidase PulO-like enzyme (type II secretory pathway)